RILRQVHMGGRVKVWNSLGEVQVYEKGTWGRWVNREIWREKGLGGLLGTGKLTIAVNVNDVEGFEQIIDFLNANPIKYALTVNPTIYTSCIKQLCATAKVNTVNGEEQIQALVDKKNVIITETSVRSDLQLEDDEGGVKFLMFPRFMQVFLDKQVEGMFKHKEIYVTPFHTKKVFANMKKQGKDFSGRVTPLFPAMLRKQKPRKTRRKDIELPQTSVHIEVVADETVYEEMYDSAERAVTTATSFDAEQDRGIINEASLNDQEDASKQGRIIDNPDADEGVTLVDETQGRNDQDMFDTGVLDDEEVVAEKEVSTADPVTTAGVEVSVDATTPTISMDDITLAKSLATLKVQNLW
nr:hypothetical protein [Tanacetum cinerariifolium]